MSTLAAFLTTILNYIDRPWKVVSIIALVFFGVIAFTVYERRGEIVIGLLRGYGTPHLLVDKFKEQAPSLMKNTRADATTLLGFKLDSNWIEPIAGYSRGGSEWMPNPTPRPLFHFTTQGRDTIDIINGQIICRDILPDGPLLRPEYELGARRFCFIGVPPVTGSIVGLLAIVWNTPLSPSEEYDAGQTLRSTAYQIVSWNFH